ncbi:MAG TPA: diacylglycerol kinase family protein [Puia sp.]|jgi:diacylglycerol kinase (ATP)|nr:diacylglycerol kinase family protein [Puia sp.]
MEQQKFSFRSRLKSFSFALSGIREFLIREHNARIHLVATVAVIVAAYAFRVSNTEWALLAIVTGAVWTTEMLNTCIEKIMDFVDPEEHPLIKSIKDLAAGAVLAAAFTAVVVGLLIFIPKVS